MGNPISSLRSVVDQSGEERLKMQERLNILEKMVNYLLDNAKTEMLHGDRGDQRIYTGTVIDFNKQVNISLENHKADELDVAIKNFFGQRIAEGFKKIVTASVDAVLGNASMGEHQGSNMFIEWSDNALLRLDAFYYRWNFSSTEIINGVEGVSGVLVMKRVIKLGENDPQVLTWAISRQASGLGNAKDASDMIEEALAIIRKVNALQQAINSKEVEQQFDEEEKNTDDN